VTAAGTGEDCRARGGNRLAKARERALLAEFLSHGDVASLARAIARRLGGGVREADLIAGAELETNRKRE